MISRRSAIFASGAFLALAACGRGKAAGAVLRVGSQKGGTKALLLSSGALDGASYQVEWSEFPAAQGLLEALGSGAVDVGLVGDAPFQFAYQSGSPIKVVSAQRAEPRVRGALGIVVPKESAARSIRDLVGKRIATTRGSIGHYLILRALAEAGLAPKDIKITYLAPSDARAAIQTGAIDAWSTWVPYLSAAQAEGARIIADGLDYWRGTSFDVVHDSVLENKRQILTDFLAREAKALEWAQAHVAAFAHVLAGETGLPDAIAREMIAKNNRRRVPIDSAMIADQTAIFDTFRNAGEVKAVRPIAEAFVDIR